MDPADMPRFDGAPGHLHADTLKLLRTGAWIFGVGLLAAASMLFAFGGVTRQGPHSNSGWLALMIAMGCVPTGLLTLVLGVTKAISDRRG